MSKPNKFTRLLGLLTFGLIIWCCSTQVEPPVLKIAYNVWYDTLNDDYEIFVMDIDGKNQKNISTWKGVDWVYATYKDKIYFLSDRDSTHRKYFMYEMDANGENIKTISNFLLMDSWLTSRKEGTEFIVTSKTDGEKAFYIIDRNGDVKTKIIPALGTFNDPTFSPDGKQIVFRGSKDKFSKDRIDVDELYIMNEDGSEMQQITHYPKEDTTVIWHNYHAGPPFWDPNSNTISYMSFQNSNYSIYTIRPDGSDAKKLTDDSMHHGYHSWSPDGKWIVFDAADLQNKNYDIYMMKSDGSDIQRLTSDWKFEQAPVFVEIQK